jgi:UDP-N-acetylmuramate dehydrogenase
MQENISIQAFNTFGIDVKARYYFSLQTLTQLEELASLPAIHSSRLVLGGGSNVLFTRDFNGIVIHNQLRGIEVVEEDDDTIWVKAAAGENWHSFVLHCIENNWCGIENLSLIPGKVGASPMQNIGAYGMEIKDVFHELEAWNIQKEQVDTFDREDCQFGYRESVFKHDLKNQYLILSVTFRLSKRPNVNVSYGAIEEVLNTMGVENPGIKEVSNAIIAIRQSKLPDPAEIGNAGSFFKNPVVSDNLASQLISRYPHMPSYKVSKSEVKIPAGWLIEQAGWKGKRFNNYGVHEKQALVLVNYGGAKGQEIVDLSHEIQRDVQEKFGIIINPEVNFI